jgi:hypothetical protein
MRRCSETAPYPQVGHHRRLATRTSMEISPSWLCSRSNLGVRKHSSRIVYDLRCKIFKRAIGGRAFPAEPIPGANAVSRSTTFPGKNTINRCAVDAGRFRIFDVGRGVISSGRSRAGIGVERIIPPGPVRACFTQDGASPQLAATTLAGWAAFRPRRSCQMFIASRTNRHRLSVSGRITRNMRRPRQFERNR